MFPRISEEIHGLDHRMCGSCYIDMRSARLPVTEAFYPIEQCCWCGRLTSSGIVFWTVWRPPKCQERSL